MRLVRQASLTKDNNSVLIAKSEMLQKMAHCSTLFATSLISAASSGAIGLEKTTPCSSAAKLVCNGTTSNPQFGVRYGGGMTPSIGSGVHKAAGVMVIGFSDSRVAVVVVDMM